MSAQAPRSQTSGSADEGQRLQKVLAAAGFGSRRECEELITTGRVEIDRQVADQLGVRVDPQRHEIRVNGVVLKQPRLRYILLNKPTGVVCTQRDPEGRTRAVDLVRTDQRVYPVGRLDRNSEGMLLMTNDGDFSNHLTHPRYGVKKTYHVLVAGRPTNEQLAELRQGVYLAEGLARVDAVVIKKRLPKATLLEIVLSEGRNREIRRVLAKVGHKVMKLKRVAIGSIRMGAMDAGAHRELTREEVQTLLSDAGAAPTQAAAVLQIQEAEVRSSGGVRRRTETPRSQKAARSEEVGWRQEAPGRQEAGPQEDQRLAEQDHRRQA